MANVTDIESEIPISYPPIGYLQNSKSLNNIKSSSNIKSNNTDCIVNGRIDLIVREMNNNEPVDIIYEIKCVNEILLEHKLQIILYAFMMTKQIYYENQKRDIENQAKLNTANLNVTNVDAANLDANQQQKRYRYRLYNIKTDELISIRYDSDVIEQIYNKLVNNKIAIPQHLTDKEFIEKNLSLCDFGEYKDEYLENIDDQHLINTIMQKPTAYKRHKSVTIKAANEKIESKQIKPTQDSLASILDRESLIPTADLFIAEAP